MQDFEKEWSPSGAFSLQLITDSLPVLVAYIDQNLKYVFMNQTYETWFGRPRSEMMGQSLREVLSPAIYEAVLPAIKDALTGKKTQYQLKVPSRLGGFRFIEGMYTPDIAPDGKVRGVISHVSDVTEKKCFEEALKQTQNNDQFLAEAGQMLSSNLELEQIFSALGGLVVPRLADWYGIELLNPEGRLETVTALHVDSEKISLALRMRRDFPSAPDAPAGPAAVARTGRSECIEWMSDEMLKAVVANPQYLAVLQKLGFRSVAIVPLRVQGKIIGVMEFVHAESGRRFEKTDIGLLESLAYRVGLAVENAQLYAETKKQRDRLYELLMRAPVAISVRRGPDLVYELVNRPYQDFVGKDRPLLGSKYLDVFPEAAPELLKTLRLCAVEGRSFSEPEFHVTLDWNTSGQPSEKILNLVYEPLLNAAGKPEGVISFAFEVTDQVIARRKIEEIAKNFQVLAETIPHMVWTAEADGRANFYNQRWYEYTGMLPAQTLSDSGTQFVHPEDLPGMLRTWEGSIVSGAPYEFEIRMKNADDQKYRWFIARALPIHDEVGRIEKWFGTCTEIQGQKELEENLIRARMGAERASLAKSNFLANMSHEIRTPMTAVLGFTEFLRDPELSDLDKAECVNRIERSGRSLLRLIDDILDISKIEAGHLHLEHYSFSPLEIVSEVVAMLKLPASQKNVPIKILLESDIPERIISDPTRVRQILLNLVGNSTKFTQAGSIVVALRFHKVGTRNLLSFEVRDTGIGISPDDQPRLFSAFVQADESITRKFGGSGLGLALSRRLAENLGGSLELVRSSPGVGSTFRVQIECGSLTQTAWTRRAAAVIDVEPQVQPATYTKADKVLYGRRILLTEDVADNRALIRSYLEAAGAEVDIAENGQQAVDQISCKAYDLVLMDIQMPLLDGIQATRQIRSLGYAGPIFALTAHAMPEERALSLAAGCTDHLTKPISRTTLITQIQSQLP